MTVNELLIKRLSYLEKIDLLREKYSKKFQKPIPNISGWQIDEDYRTLMLRSFCYDKYGYFDPINYVYSYDLFEEKRKLIINKLGGFNSNRILVVPNNTIALVNVVNFIAKYSNHSVGLLLPCYFSIPNLLNNQNISYTLLSMIHTSDGYNLPIEEINKKKCNVLILTSPVFSTGKYLQERDIQFLSEFLKRGNFIIADESLAVPGTELIRFFGKYKNFLSIYSPHKFIHFNSFKFSCIIFNRAYEDFFDQWNDIFSGGLNITNLRAINHFISDNYNQLVSEFLSYTKENYNKVSQLLDAFPGFSTDVSTSGDYMCVYNKLLPYKLGNQLPFIRDVIKHTHSLFYPGCLHGFQKGHGFVFRINLVSFNNMIGCSLVKILNYLSKL